MRRAAPLSLAAALAAIACSSPDDAGREACAGGKCDELGAGFFADEGLGCPSQVEARSLPYRPVLDGRPGATRLADRDAYDRLSGRAKRDRLWDLVSYYAYPEGCLPGGADFFAAGEKTRNMVPSPLDLRASGMGLAFNFLGQGAQTSDEMQPGRRKFLHQWGVVAPAELVIDASSPYQGLLGPGAVPALVRASLAIEEDASTAFTPGMAIKLLVDGRAAATINLMDSLDGQDHDRDYFELPFSHRLLPPQSVALKLAAQLFRVTHDPPNALGIGHLGVFDARGAISETGLTPGQLIFVPTAAIQDRYRAALAAVEATTPAGAIPPLRAAFQRLEVPADGLDLYEVWAVDVVTGAPVRPRDALAACQASASCSRIGRLRLLAPPVASAFGDFRLWFRHNHEAWRLEDQADAIDQACQLDGEACLDACMAAAPRATCEEVCAGGC